MSYRRGKFFDSVAFRVPVTIHRKSLLPSQPIPFRNFPLLRYLERGPIRRGQPKPCPHYRHGGGAFSSIVHPRVDAHRAVPCLARVQSLSCCNVIRPGIAVPPPSRSALSHPKNCHRRLGRPNDVSSTLETAGLECILSSNGGAGVRLKKV